MITQRTIDNQFIARFYPFACTDVLHIRFKNAGPGSCNKQLIAFSLVNNFCITGNDLYSCF